MTDNSASQAWLEYRRQRLERSKSSRQVSLSAIRDLIQMPTAFRAWLLDHDPGTIVGDCYTPDNATVANFLWDAIGVYVWVADEITYGSRSIGLPNWYQEYQLAEYEHVQKQAESNGELTADEALIILDSVGGEVNK